MPFSVLDLIVFVTKSEQTKMPSPKDLFARCVKERAVVIKNVHTKLPKSLDLCRKAVFK